MTAPPTPPHPDPTPPPAAGLDAARQAPPTAPPAITPPPSALQQLDSLADEQENQQPLPATQAFLRDARVPGWLVSGLLHGGVLLFLALWTVVGTTSNLFTIQARFEREEPTPIELTPPMDRPVVEIRQTEAMPDHAIEAAVEAVEFEKPEALTATAPTKPLDTIRKMIDGLQQPTSTPALRMRGNAGIEGRVAGKRQELAEKYGASDASEQAVEAALDWLVAHQQNNGSWDFDLSHAPCNGQCRNPRSNPDGQATPKTAATGLALLPFLGAGYTHRSGKHAETVSRGLYYLRSQLRDAAVGRELMHGSMYGHGIATLAVAEAYAMTKDEDLVDMLRDLQSFIVMAQHEKGGWRYNPGQPGDMTITGWQIMALKSCQIGGLPFPTSVHSRAEDFVTSLGSQQGSRFGYLEPVAEATPTAVGLLLQMYLSKPPGDAAIMEGCHYLYELGPSKTNVYFNYYATMTLHHARYYGFPEWNAKLRDYLVKTQSRRGHEVGSWHFTDRFGNVGGRLYSTAMCALVLETYYRYLPLWAEAEFPL
ncbi:prenyltransferase/squalene oxidase repeat-containing protein [Rosistilla oblonga]|uniref:prenyltransferase/squalene oxidase repeat-containing protein n=1 Tax=Rosistilla oblonga TaxID=2527990 RepID=UPI003A973ECB